MPSISSDASSSKAGIITTSEGERHIPSSTRADGSVRKEIKVRPGYRPPEDVEVYKNQTATAWKNRGKGRVPGAELVDSTKGRTPTKGAKKSKAAKKPAPDNADEKDKGSSQTTDRDAGKTNEESGKPDEPLDVEAEKDKDAKKLTKKLRQARDLQQKREKGDVLLPEQFEKVIRINELIRQLDNLGFDADGQKKSEPS